LFQCKNAYLLPIFDTMNDDNFFSRVYEVVALIPFGRVTSYGAIAGYLGTRGSARMVGWAMNATHHSIAAIPAHRVVNRNGLLTGKRHFDGPDIMRQLLESEGIVFKGDQIANFSEVFWNPILELL
jgi:methylated-DNA-protein-cysteine methyltransferase-like protein